MLLRVSAAKSSPFMLDKLRRGLTTRALEARELNKHRMERESHF